MKILYVTTIGGTISFFKRFIEELVQNGHEVDIACNNLNSPVPDFYLDLGCEIHTIQTARSPLKKGNFTAINQLRKLVEENQYNIVHCHTPVAAMCTRLACRKARKNGTRVFYTAHGFHFYKGAPLKNWLLYYPVEKFFAHFTDVLITINKEDYDLAQKKMKAKRVEYVPGVGIDLTKFGQATVDKATKRKGLGIPKDATLLLSVGELNENKNHETVIRAIKDLDAYYIIAGKGDLQEHLQSVIDEFGLTERVKLLGFRADVAELYQAADIYVLPSVREGLNVSIMEAMASGLPVVCSKIRGNTDLIDNGECLFTPLDTEEINKAITTAIKNKETLGRINLEKIQNFDLSTVESLTSEIYGGYEHLVALMQRVQKREELYVPNKAMLLVSVGELNENKNHETVIRAIAELNNTNIYYCIAGKGERAEYLKNLISELNLTNQVQLLGFRSDISALYYAADICVFPSYREGLGLAAIEGMACGLPLIAADNRGTRDFCVDGENGIVCSASNYKSFASAIKRLCEDKKTQREIGKKNTVKALAFDVERINERMKEIYEIAE